MTPVLNIKSLKELKHHRILLVLLFLVSTLSTTLLMGSFAQAAKWSETDPTVITESIDTGVSSSITLTFTQYSSLDNTDDYHGIDGTSGFRYFVSPASNCYAIYFEGEPSEATSATLIKGFTDGGGVLEGVCNLMFADTLGSVTLEGTQAGSGGGGGGEGEEGDTVTSQSCVVKGIGWIVCPAAIFLGNLTDTTYGILENFMVFSLGDDALDTNNPDNVVFKVWSNIRNFANIFFIVVFFVIILSQATSVGISTYGIKKTLPRLIAAAILVNLSYWICILAIDFSNIIGAGVDGLIRAPIEDSSLYSSDDRTFNWSSTTTNILLGIGLGVGLVAGAFLAFLGPLLGLLGLAFIAIMTALLVVIFRQVALVFLIILSPLAFAAFILPGTESWFGKWRSFFLTMLVFYPLMAALFAASKVASAILRLAAPDGGMGMAWYLASLGALSIPLILSPWLIKFSGSTIGRIAGIVNNPNKGIADRMRNFGNERDKYSRGRAASGYDPNAKGPGGKLKNILAKGVARQNPMSRRGAYRTAQMGSEWTKEETTLAGFKYQNISGDKDSLETEIRKGGKSSAEIKALTGMLGSLGADKQLNDIIKDGSLGDDVRKAAIAAVTANADKFASSAPALLATAGAAQTSLSKPKNQGGFDKASDAYNEALDKVFAKQVQSKISPESTTRFSASHWEDIGEEYDRLMNTGNAADIQKATAMKQAVTTAIHAGRGDARIDGSIAQEQRVAQDDLLTTMGSAPAPRPSQGGNPNPNPGGGGGWHQSGGGTPPPGGGGGWHQSGGGTPPPGGGGGGNQGGGGNPNPGGGGGGNQGGGGNPNPGGGGGGNQGGGGNPNMPPGATGGYTGTTGPSGLWVPNSRNNNNNNP